MTAAEVKAALRRHHPSGWQNGMPPQWTCLEELWNIDLLAWSAWSSGTHGRYARVGYEVKVSRSDYRVDLLAPHKRLETMRYCHRAYYAVPAGLLKPDELGHQEPLWRPEDFEPERCPNPACHAEPGRSRWRLKPRGSRLRGTPSEGVTIYGRGGWHEYTDEHGTHHVESWDGGLCCTVCKGYGKVASSRVEREAPYLWVPADMGLVEITSRGVRVVKRAPKREPEPIPDSQLAAAIRWASLRPDNGHVAQLSG